MAEKKRRQANGSSMNGNGRSGGFCDPIGLIEEEHTVQLEFCDVLEFFADSLPEIPDRRLAHAMVPILRDGWPKHIQLEEELLLPALRQRATSNDPILPVMERLEEEHSHDCHFADEVAEEFERLAFDGNVRNADMFGYMLRGFFEGQRRHISWENNVLIPIARAILKPEDLVSLHAGMSEHGRAICAKRSIERILLITHPERTRSRRKFRN